MDLDDVPTVVTAWVAAKNAHDVDGQLACFSPAAEVDDEDKVHRGTEQVRAWIERVTAAYALTVVPEGWDGDATGGVLTALVSGDFPGSPLTFRYHLGLDADRITNVRTES